MKLDPVKVMEVLGMLEQTKEKKTQQIKQKEDNNSQQRDELIKLSSFLGRIFEGIMIEEFEVSSKKFNSYEPNRFGRVEPNYKTQEDKEVRLNLQKLLLSEMKVAMTLEEDKTEELIEKYLENFTKRELATLLYNSRTK